MRLMTKTLLTIFWMTGSLLAQATGSADQNPSACHVFIDDENIWTLEVLEEPDRSLVPILNIITFTPGRWDFRPGQVSIQGAEGTSAQVRSFSMDTGVPGEPYVMEYLAVRGNSFLGLDLIGNFEEFAAPSQVTIDLGRYRFELQPLDCAEFNRVAGQIDQVNFDSPNLWEDFRVLEIQFIGGKIPRPE